MKTKHQSRRFRRFLRANEAVSALEYALLVGVVAVGVGGAIVAFQDEVVNALEGIETDLGMATDIQGAANPTP